MAVEEINSQLMDSQTTLQKFYAGQNILITGGSGFLGKIFIEKILRSCPDVSSIFLLIREKRGQNAYERLDRIFEDSLFDRLKVEVPKFRHKVVAIAGDCSLPELGMSKADQELIAHEVSIVFYMAASVRFDEPLKNAVINNIAGPIETMKLCKEMKNLKACIHVSTAYSNSVLFEIDEKFYEPPISADNLLKMVRSLSEEKINTMTPSLLGKFPNIYTFTKCIAESAVRQYGAKLPVGIYRPAIISSSYVEPISGWVGNYYGPTGLVAAVGIGFAKVYPMNANHKVQLIPSDYAANALIAMAWDVANNKNQDADPIIYNYSTSSKCDLTWGKYMSIVMKYGKKKPTVKSIWSYSLIMASNRYLFMLLALLLHFIPGIIIDAALFLIGKQPKLINLHKKLYKFSEATCYFTINTWKFHCNNTNKLWDKLASDDKKVFAFSMENFNWDSYCQKIIDGMRIYIFKDDPSTLPLARKRMSRILMFNKLFNWSFIMLSTWVFYLIASYVLSSTRSELSSVSDGIVMR